MNDVMYVYLCSSITLVMQKMQFVEIQDFTINKLRLCHLEFLPKY